MKSLVTASGGDQTAQTRVFDIVRGAPWPAQYPGRALKNDFYQRWHGNEEQLQAERSGAEKSYLATKPDDFSARVVWAGEGVDLVKDVPSAAELIERIVAQAASVLRRNADLLR
jgi:nitronate monooxygenase